MKWLFDSKKKTPSETKDIQKIGSRMVRIKSLDMFGPFSESDDGQYLLVRQDTDRERGIGGYRESGNGRFALIDSGQSAFVGECERPTEGEVANTGTFAIIDSLFGDKLGSKLYVYSLDGELQLLHSFSANTFNVGISADGAYVVVQLAFSDTDDSGKLYLFDANHSKIISAFAPETGWADKYVFSVPEKIVSLSYKNNRQYRYLFDGTFLDRQLYDRERVEDASPTELVRIVRERLSDSTNETLPILLLMINRAFEGNLSQHRDYQALACRLKGEIQEALGDVKQAILAYQEALSIDPKIGVKQKLKKLLKANQTSESSNTSNPRKKQPSKPSEISLITGAEVRTVLYNFTQHAFIGSNIKDEPLSIEYFPRVLAILQAGQLTQHDLNTQLVPIQRVLYELLTQYIMFLSMNPSLPFPPSNSHFACFLLFIADSGLEVS